MLDHSNMSVAALLQRVIGDEATARAKIATGGRRRRAEGSFESSSSSRGSRDNIRSRLSYLGYCSASRALDARYSRRREYTAVATGESSSESIVPPMEEIGRGEED